MLIFDLDGTLLNTAKDLQVALNHALRAHGFPEKSEPETLALLGNGIDCLVADALPNGRNNPNFELTYADFKTYYAAHLNDYTAETATDDMEETLLIAEFDAKLRHWLDALPAECRKIIDLALDGKKNAEIAEALSLSVQTVKNQKVKGLKLLRELYRRDYALLLLFIRLFMERI